MPSPFIPGSYATPTILTPAATVNIDPSVNGYQQLTLNQNTTFTIGQVQTSTIGQSGPEGTQTPAAGVQIFLELHQDGTGSRTGTFPSNVLFAGGSKTLTTTASAIDLVELTYNPVTGNWLANLLKAFA